MSREFSVIPSRFGDKSIYSREICSRGRYITHFYCSRSRLLQTRGWVFSFMPRLYLPWSSYDLFVYDFLNDFFGIVGSYKPRRMCLHCLRSPYDFFRLQTWPKLYRDLANIVRQPQGYRTIIVLSSRPPYIIRTMSVRWPCGSRKESVRWLCNCRVIMCMDLNGYPCSFLHSIWTMFQSHVITNRAMKRLVFFCWTWSQGM